MITTADVQPRPVADEGHHPANDTQRFPRSNIDCRLFIRAQEMVHAGTWIANVHADTPGVYDDVLWSDEMFRMHGLEPGSVSVSLETFISVVHPDDRDRVSSVIASAIAERMPYRFDYRVATSDGHLRVNRARGNMELDEHGNIVRLLGTCIDVTDRHRAEEALVESEARFRSLFEQSAVGMAVADKDGRLLQANRSFAEFLMYDVAELEGKSLAEITYAADRDISRSGWSHSTVERASTYEKRYVRRDGAIVWARVTVSRLQLPGREAGFMGIVEDIDEKKRASLTLERQTEILRGMLDHLPVMVLRLSADGTLIYSNREARRVFGWSVDGMPTDVIAAAFQESEQREHVRDLVAAGSAEWLDLEPRAADGTVVPSSWAAITLSDGASLVIGQDLTERRQLQQNLAQSQKLEAIGQLAGGIAHDFNNMLTVISAGATFIKEEAATDVVANDAQDILNACARAASLTRQLLAFSRRQLLQPEVLDVNEVIHGLSKTMSRLLSERIAFEVVTEAAQASAEVDRTQLEQVILNLAVNARDAIKEHGTITVLTKNTTDALGRTELVIQVIDDGMGIEPAIQERMFEPFFTTKPVGKGTGLGLATVHGIVEQSGGRITVNSRPGEGATFSVYLPCVDAMPVPERPAAERAACDGKETILLVEDENTVRTIARRMLTSLGYKVIEARHGRDGLTLALDPNSKIDLVVTDVVMPEMGGRELATALRARLPNLPVLFVSGYTEDELLRRGVLEPGMRLLRKPFDKGDLARSVRGLLDSTSLTLPGR